MSHPSSNNPHPLIAVDIGNNRMKFGQFDSLAADGLPEPVAELLLTDDEPDLGRIAQWLDDGSGDPRSWWIGSVNRPVTTRLVDWLRLQRPEDSITLLAADDLPLEVSVPRPDMVGIDRLLDAVGANRLRDPNRPAVVVDLGSAITVDLISRDGRFQGGSILPGIGMSARALHEFTELLPQVDMRELAEAPAALGRSTEPAMRSGLFWGAVGGVRELITRLGSTTSGEPQVFLTGGASPAVAPLLSATARHVPHLTLGGIALCARSS